MQLNIILEGIIGVGLGVREGRKEETEIGL